MPAVLLDTHVLVWWRAAPARLSRAQVHTLAAAERAGRSLGISAITLRELATLGHRGLLQSLIPWDTWLGEIENHPLLEVLPLTARIAAESVRLGPNFPKDPADQIIVATARFHGLPLVTSDQAIRRWGKVPVV